MKKRQIIAKVVLLSSLSFLYQHASDDQENKGSKKITSARQPECDMRKLSEEYDRRNQSDSGTPGRRRKQQFKEWTLDLRNSNTKRARK